MEHGKPLHSLIPPADFTAILGIDDRDEALSRYCLTAATYTIEQYCRRRLIDKKHYETLEFHGDYVFLLRDYPVREILAVYAINNGQVTGKAQVTGNREQVTSSNEQVTSSNEQVTGNKEHVISSNGELIEPEFYRVVPDCGELEDVPHCLSVSPALRLMRGVSVLKVHYWAGYACGEVPADLASACLELAAWSMSRYRGQLAMSGEQLAIPENVRQLLEPYRRRMI
jgi:hypothetical protein